MADKAGKKTETRYVGTRALAALIPGLAKKAVGKRGFMDARVLNEWPQIVGQDLAKHAHPDRLSFPRGQRDGGTLYIRAQGPMATELQHLAPLVIDRINSHFGYRAVQAIKLLQAPPARTEQRRVKAAPTRKPLPPAAPQDLEAMKSRLEAVEDPELRAILERMGESVLRKNAAKKGAR